MRRINSIVKEYTFKTNDKWLNVPRYFYVTSKHINGAVRKFMQEYDTGRYDILSVEGR